LAKDMKTLTNFSTFTDGMSKHVAHTIFTIPLLGSMKSKIANLKGHLSLARNTEKQDETATELQRQCELKDRLLSIIAHDVLSPLYSLKSLVSLLSNQKIDKNEFQRVIASLDSQVEHLHQFTENILNLTHNNSTEIKPTFEQLLLRPLAKETVGLLSPIAERKGVYIYLDVPDSTTVFADGEMLKLILRNLITNAIQFCYPNDSIYIQAKNKDEMVSISVCDTGRGISYENIPHLFKVSHQTTKGTNNEVGIALGLTLCKEFVEKMGGKISVTSAAEKGSCFEFTVHSPTPPPSEFQKFIEKQEKSNG